MRIEEIGGATLINGDCRVVMAAMEASSIDAIVCDPPYGLSFMGKGWDHGVPGVEFWIEALRVAKPGAHLLAFGGTRTHHRLMVAIEDAGWELRDTVMWVYGSGFPKSLDVSKAIDKAAGVEREVIGEKRKLQSYGYEGNNCFGGDVDRGGVMMLTTPSTDEAKKWQGWGTALKPAWEPIIIARKPLEGTVADNVQYWGTGGINVDGCRVPLAGAVDDSQLRTMNRGQRTEDTSGQEWGMSKVSGDVPQVVRPDGRWPANLIHDGSDEVLACFPVTTSGNGDKTHKVKSSFSASNRIASLPSIGGDTGSAARFFYCAKSSKADRNEGCDHLALTIADTVHKIPRSELDDPRRAGTVPRKNSHPTVKPNSLMRYLCRLVTPPTGTVLDPFMGSGSTGKAALQEGFKFVGIELDKEHGYFDIACARIKAAL